MGVRYNDCHRPRLQVRFHPVFSTLPGTLQPRGIRRMMLDWPLRAQKVPKTAHFAGVTAGTSSLHKLWYYCIQRGQLLFGTG
jgi:hypothetical protein